MNTVSEATQKLHTYTEATYTEKKVTVTYEHGLTTSRAVRASRAGPGFRARGHRPRPHRHGREHVARRRAAWPRMTRRGARRATRASAPSVVDGFWARRSRLARRRALCTRSREHAARRRRLAARRRTAASRSRSTRRRDGDRCVAQPSRALCQRFLRELATLLPVAVLTVSKKPSVNFLKHV